MSIIKSLVYLSRYVKVKLHGGQYVRFADMTRDDVLLGYLKSLKKESEDDPDYKWMGTYNTRGRRLHPVFQIYQ